MEPHYEVERLTRALISNPELGSTQREFFIEGITYSLLAFLLGERKSPIVREESGLTNSELRRCVDYADSRLDQRLDLSNWAATLGMSASEFARRFQLKTKQSSYAWFMNWKIDRGKQLPRNPRLSLAEVGPQLDS